MMMIRKIDLLVHPFYNYRTNRKAMPGESEYGDTEAEILLEIWKQTIDEIKKDPWNVLIIIGYRLGEKAFEALKKKQKRNAENECYFESELLKYAYENLGGRLFFSKSIEALASKERLLERICEPKELHIDAYGEYTVGCVITELKDLAKHTHALKRNIRVLPKKSVDIVTGYPRLWHMEELKKMSREKRIERIRKMVKTYNDTKRIRLEEIR